MSPGREAGEALKSRLPQPPAVFAFVDSFSKHMLSACCVRGAVVGTDSLAGTKADWSLASQNVHPAGRMAVVTVKQRSVIG